MSCFGRADNHDLHRTGAAVTPLVPSGAPAALAGEANVGRKRTMRESYGFSWVLTLSVAFLATCGDDGPSAPPGPLDPSNRSRIVAEIADTTVTLGDTLRLQWVGTDPDGDELHCQVRIHVTVEELREGYRPDVVWRQTDFQYAPGSRDRPSRRFGLWASDPSGASDSMTFTVRVV
jgi:hypothetical protein